MDAQVPGHETTATRRVEKMLSSAQSLVGLNVIFVAILYLQEWLNWNGHLSAFDLHPEDVGISPQFMLVSAGVQFVGILVVATPLLGLLYYRELQRRRRNNRIQRLLLVAILLLLVVGFLVINYGNATVFSLTKVVTKQTIAVSSISYFGLAGIAFLLTTGLMRNQSRRIITGLFLILPTGVCGLLSAQFYGQLSGETIRQQFFSEEFSGVVAGRLTVPTISYPLVRFRMVGDADNTSQYEECGILLGINSGTTYIYAKKLVEREDGNWLVGTTVRLPTDATVTEDC